MQPEFQMALTSEERDAFEKAYQMHLMTPKQRQTITLACAPGFIMGYRSAKLKTIAEMDRDEHRDALAKRLNYPAEWDTAAYPDMESAVIEALAAKEAEISQKDSELLAVLAAKESEKGFYTMNQMRDYADGIVTTRAYVVIDSIENKARAFYKKADEIHADGNPNVAGVYRQIASDLTGISADAKRLGRQPFQKRAMFWARRITFMGVRLATSARKWAEFTTRLRCCARRTGSTWLARVSAICSKSITKNLPRASVTSAEANPILPKVHCNIKT